MSSTAQQAGMIQGTLAELKHLVLTDDDAPGRVGAAEVDTIVGITAYRLGMAAMARGCAIDLGNGYVLICTAVKKEGVPQ